MKHVLLIIIAGISLQLNAQATEFAPIGAKWWYTVYAPFGPPEDLILESQKDTLIGDLTCRKVTKTLHEYYLADTYHNAGYELFYQDSSKIYLLDQLTGELKDYFDYSAELDDTIKTMALSDNPSITSEYSESVVMDVKDTVVEGETLKMFILENITPVPDDFTFIYPIRMLEKIGSIEQRFPEFIYAATDIPRAGPLRCYEDAGGLVKFIPEECEHTVAISELENDNYSLYPNPADDRVFLMSDEVINKVILYDIHGNEFYLGTKSEEKSFSFSISSLANGLYFVSLYADDKLIGTEKILKQ